MAVIEMRFVTFLNVCAKCSMNELPDFELKPAFENMFVIHVKWFRLYHKSVINIERTYSKIQQNSESAQIAYNWRNSIPLTEQPYKFLNVKMCWSLDKYSIKCGCKCDSNKKQSEHSKSRDIFFALLLS